jgi:PAS domain S-box-containing protein
MGLANQALVRQTESLRAEILHRQQIETELREREVQYHNLADSGLALIWTAGTDKLCSYFNEPWLKFTGRPLEKEVGNGWAEGVHPDDFDRCLATYVAAFDQREAFEMEYRLMHHSGEYRWITDMGTPNFNSRGEFVGYIGHCFDITEKIKYQEAIQRNDKLDSLGILAGGIAHDFNNLLAGLFAYLSLARDHSASDLKTVGYLNKALAAFERAKDLTRQLLTFSKGGTPEKRTGHLGPLVKESAEFALSGSNVKASFFLEADLPTCEFDANQVGQVIDNLVINAQQALTQGGEISVTVRAVSLRDGDHPRLKPGTYVEVTVADNGPGIPPSILPHIFDPFFTTKPKGNGLGLSTCYSIVQRHDGTVDVETEVGRGTRFRVLLPASTQHVLPLPPATVGAHSGRGTILVLDDEELLRDLTTEWLGGMGYRVVATSDGLEALVALDKGPPAGGDWAAALLDLTVPGGMGGKEAAADIRRRLPFLPVFATSGYSEDPVMANPEGYGFTGSLRKPYLREELGGMLERYLGDQA